MRKLFEQDIIEILYGATFYGAGGGGSLYLGLKMLQLTKEEGTSIEVNMIDVDEMDDDSCAAVVAALGSPVAMLEPPMFGPDGVYAFNAFKKALKAANGREVKYIMSGEMGGHNTFVPIQVVLNSAKNADDRIPFVDADCNGRACPELNTTLTTYWNYPPTPIGLGSFQGDELAVYPINDKSGEAIARQMCQMYGSRIGFSTWGLKKDEIKAGLLPGYVTIAQNAGKAFFAARENGTDIVEELAKVGPIREFCRGKIVDIKTEVVGGFDVGTTVIEGNDGHTYYVTFKNENLALSDETGKIYLTAPDCIELIDLETITPLTNAETKVGMDLVVTMTPAHENWWDPERKPYECWLEEIEAAGLEAKPVRF